ncbi:MAG: cobalamin B12-binding domain-containing protein [Gammaproteobacteria bacterium]|nr:cobalamin B12-binding domain-containing protein [Gammaproteobacteria bacterium]
MRVGDVSGDQSSEVCREGWGDPAQQSPSCAPAPESGPGRVAPSDGRLSRLIRTIEGEIVPRLVLSRRKSGGILESAAARAPDTVDVEEAVRLLLHHDVSVCSAFVGTLRDRGATIEMICLDLLAPAARCLGRMWEEDECDFMQVTVGLCRLHQLLRELSADFRTEVEERAGDRRILLAACPGEQHTFGLALVAQFLRRAGWEVWHELPTTKAAILEIASQHWFAVVGLSLATETRIEVLTETIADLRRTSRNRAVGVLVGGPLLIARPELTPIVGADGTADNGALAVVRAEHMLRALTATN